jgi:hypothetical protein
MKRLFKIMQEACLGALVACLVAAMAVFSPALATTLTITPTKVNPARFIQTQQVHYARFSVNFNDYPMRAADKACSKYTAVTLPYNAFMITISKKNMTTFNPTTSATIALGTSGQGVDVMAAFNVFTGQATTAVFDTAFAAAGELVTGNGATQTGQKGGFDVYMTYTVGAAGSQGTQGRVIFIIAFFAPNDGDCNLGATTAPAELMLRCLRSLRCPPGRAAYLSQWMSEQCPGH